MCAYAIGALSDTLTAEFGDDLLRYSILAGTGFYVISGNAVFHGRPLAGESLGRPIQP